MSIWLLPCLAFLASLVAVLSKTSRNGSSGIFGVSGFGWITIILSATIAVFSIHFNNEKSKANAIARAELNQQLAVTSEQLEKVDQQLLTTIEKLEDAEIKSAELGLQVTDLNGKLTTTNQELTIANSKLATANEALDAMRGSLAIVQDSVLLTNDVLQGLPGEEKSIPLFGKGRFTYVSNNCHYEVEISERKENGEISPYPFLTIGKPKVGKEFTSERFASAKVLFGKLETGVSCRLIYGFDTSE